MKAEIRILSKTPSRNLLPHARDGAPKDYFISLHFAHRKEVEDVIERLQDILQHMHSPTATAGARFNITSATVVDDTANIFL